MQLYGIRKSGFYPEGLQHTEHLRPIVRLHILNDRPQVVEQFQHDDAVKLRPADDPQIHRQFRNRVGSAELLVPVAQAENVKIDTTGLHGQRDFIRGVGQDEENAKMLLTHSPGQLSPAFSNARGGYVVAILENVQADSTQFVAQQAQLIQNLERTKQNRVYGDWLKLAREEVGVVDNRFLYYTDF